MKKILGFFLLILSLFLLASCKRNNTVSTVDEEQKTTEKNNQGDLISVSKYLTAYDFEGVKLSISSNFKKELDYAMEYLLEIPVDDYLKIFRQRAIDDGMTGIKDPSTANYLMGWYDTSMWAATMMYQQTAAMIRGYKITGDQRLKNRAIQIIDGFIECIEDDGYFFPVPRTSNIAANYELDKALLMLADAYEYLEYVEVLPAIRKMVDFAQKNFITNRYIQSESRGIGATTLEGLSDQEWYTTSEQLYRLYLLTDDKYYLEYAEFWDYTEMWKNFADANRDGWAKVHAYSNVNSASSAGIKSLVTKDEKDIEVLMGFFWAFQKYEMYPNGGFGAGEQLTGGNRLKQEAINSTVNDCEIPCCSFAVLKASRYTMQVTANPYYSEWAEKMLFNGVLGALRIYKDDFYVGKSFYYANYQNEALKNYYGDAWPCCSGTYFLDLVEVANQIYYQGDDGIYVTNYVDSQLTTTFDGKQVVLTQETNYPEELTSKFTINVDGETTANLRFRKPEKTKSIKVKINGQDTAVYIKNGWICIQGSFSDGDTVELAFDYQLNAEQVDEGSNEMVMAMYGNIYMVSRTIKSSIVIKKGKNLADYVTLVDGIHIYVTDEIGNSFEFVPYYEIDENETYMGSFKLEVKENE